MKKALITVLFIWIVQSGWSQTNFDWTLALSSNAATNLSQPIKMETGDDFTLYIRSETPSYCYIILEDSQRKVQVIKANRLAAREPFTLTITLTPPSGSETFYVVMSQIELRDLRTRIIAHERNTSPRNARDLTTAVLTLRRDVSVLRENPERPVFMGGAFRGADDSFNGTEFSGANLYVKTIIIEH